MLSGHAARKADVLAHMILEKIVRGEVQPGQLLPREGEIAQTFGVARTVVREAIKLLEVHKLVRPTKRLGTVALDPLTSPSPDVMRAMLFRDGKINLEVFAGWLEIRAPLDAQMSELAAARRSAEDLEAIREAHDLAEQSVHDPELFSIATFRLARAIAHATKNPLFIVLAEWHATVVLDVEHVFRAIRSAAVPHASGMGILVDCIAKQKSAEAKELVLAFHTWATPRLLAAARAANGDLDAVPAKPRAAPRSKTTKGRKKKS